MNARAYTIVAAAIAGLIALVALRRSSGDDCVLCKLGEKAAGAAVDLVNGAFVGSVKGIGAAVGIPDTNAAECELALAQGRYWDASFACPAGTFLKGVFSPPSSSSSSAAAPPVTYDPITNDDYELGLAMSEMQGVEAPYLGNMGAMIRGRR